MITARRTGQQIHSALQKLRNDSNGRELELIDLIASIYDTAKDAKDSAVEKTQDTMITLNNSVHSNPWYYISGAAVVGFLCAMFVRR